MKSLISYSNHNNLRFFTLGLLSIFTCITQADVQVKKVITGDDDNQNVVIITGEKIERTVQDTNTSTSVFLGEDIDKGRDRNIYDIMDRASNVLAAPSGVPHIRGIKGSGPAEGGATYVSGARPRVSTSIDGVTDSWTGVMFAKPRIWDVEQIEILKGSQSTTQGRNTIGGAIVVKTKDPTYEQESAFRVGYENNDAKYHYAVMTSAGIIDNELAFRIAADGSHGNSHIDYALPDGDQFPWDPSKTENTNIRAKLLWEPESIAELSAKLTVALRDEKGQYSNLVTEPYFEYEYIDAFGTRRQETESQTVNIDLKYSISDSLTSYLLVSQRKYETFFTFYPDEPYPFDGEVKEDNDTLEARLIYDPKNGSVTAVAGLFLYQRKQELWVGPGSFITNDDLNTHALFGETTIALNDQFDLILGGRVEKEKQIRDVSRPYIPEDDFAIDENKTIYLPKVGASYQLNTQSKLALTARKGYNAGGGGFNFYDNSPFIYGREESTTYEFSTRNSFHNNETTINANIFFSEYENYQVDVEGPSDSPRDLLITNIPLGESYGAELDINMQITSDLEIYSSLGVAKTKITTPIDYMQETKGNEFSFAPEITATLGFNQFFDSGLYVGGWINYVSEYYSDIQNNMDKQAGNYTAVNLDGGYEADDYAIRFYVKNLFEKEYVYRFARGSAEVSAPTTYGISLDYRF